MEGKPIKVKNNTATKLLFCDFNAGDNAIPFDTAWIDAGKSGELKVGNFKSLSIGVQVQEGGRWIGGDPKDKPYATAGGTVEVNITKSAT